MNTEQTNTAGLVTTLKAIAQKKFNALYGSKAQELLALLHEGDLEAFEDLMDFWRGEGYDIRKVRGAVTRLLKRAESQGGKKVSGGGGSDPFAPLVEAAEFWKDQRGAPYASVPVEDHVEHLQVGGAAFADWLSLQFWKTYGEPPDDRNLREFIKVVRGRALYGGEQHQTWIRVGQHGGRLYVDLADPDWRVVEIGPDGWEVIDGVDAPVRFRRSGDELALPIPSTGVDAEATLERLQQVLNLKEPEHLKLVLGAMVGALRPGRPCCVLLLICEPGSAKTTAMRTICSVVDPRIAQEAGAPPSEWDMAVVAHGQWMVSWDNVGRITEEEANAICRIVTGGGHRKRGLFTDESVHALALQRPVVMTGLRMPSARSDFVDRSIAVELGVIDQRRRLAEATVERRLAELRPDLFGVLLDGASAALRGEEAARERLEGSRLPRMADFTIWVEAAGEAFGWGPNDFRDIYESVLRQRMAEAAEDDPLLAAIAAMVQETPFGALEGKAGDLLALLRRHVEREWRRRTTPGGSPIGRSPAESRWFPVSPHALAGQLKQHRRPLEALGIRWTKQPDPHSRTAGAVHRLASTRCTETIPVAAQAELARVAAAEDHARHREWLKDFTEEGTETATEES